MPQIDSPALARLVRSVENLCSRQGGDLHVSVDGAAKICSAVGSTRISQQTVRARLSQYPFCALRSANGEYQARIIPGLLYILCGLEVHEAAWLRTARGM
eukprot:8095400-Pyramimonas_sp.AAC.1